MVCGINIMPVVFWSQSRWQIIEINKTIDLGHTHSETSTTSKLEQVRVASKAIYLTN